MRTQTRRQIIGSAILAALSVPVHRLLAFGSQTSGTSSPASPRRLALTAVRVINTAQLEHLKETGKFASLQELGRPEMRDKLSRSYKPDVLQLLTLGKEEVVPGFRVSLHLSSDRSSYKVYVIEASDEQGRRFAYASDDDGVINEGSVGAPSESPDKTFKGEPIRQSSDERPGNGLSALGMAVLAFFVPTLRASDPCGTCAQCFNGSASECGQTCGVNCCSLGYFDCRWCCKSFHVCDCAS